MRKSEILILIIILISFLIGWYFYSKMPDVFASHWNIKGEVNGYMPKFWGLFLMPFISSDLFLIFILIPRVDPLKANIEKFTKYYDLFIIITILFLLYIYLLTILWNIGMRFNMGMFISPALGILFFICGVLIENAKRNWFIGIRTPWTLSSDIVWNRTHRIGGRLFKIAGAMCLLCIILPDKALFFILISVILFTIYLVIFSYIEYQKE
ncbi:MAG: SdpI family protein, partial [bacterium]